MSDLNRPVATPSQTVGPFFHFGLATNHALGRVAGPNETGERITLRIRVLDGDGVPVPDALVEIYHADASGAYPRPRSEPASHGGFTGFGRLPTDPDGSCLFETIRPGTVHGSDGVQAPHINVCVLARGLLRQLYTRIYFAGDEGHDEDPILRLVPAGRARTLIAQRHSRSDPATTPGAGRGSREPTWEFTLRLQGADETVFFDL
jgi:protocatechuate 3,4-dioxygenase alpha subunit